MFESINYRWMPGEEVSISLITPDIGYEIYEEMDRCEPFQFTHNSYSEEYYDWLFIRAIWEKATKSYPIAMHRAKIKYFVENP